MPGTNIVYTIAVSNSGPNPVTGVPITDALPLGIHTATWTCAAGPGAACGAATGSGAINTTADIPVGGTVTYTLTMLVPSTRTGSLTNRASVIFVDADPSNNTAQDVDTEAQFDWGDAPASYGTSAASNGARHIISGPYLGAGPPDAEPDGVPSATANGDDLAGSDDEDGVTFPALVRGATVPIQVTVGNASAATRLQAWIDWASDGSFAQAGDQILLDAPVVNGVNTFNVLVPLSTSGGVHQARFRIADASGVTSTGFAASGEVEDHRTGSAINQYDVSVTKTDNSLYYRPGTDVTYTMVVLNAGPSAASGVFTDPLPAGTTGGVWTCTQDGGPCASGTGGINLFLTLPPHSSVTFLYTVTVPSSFSGNLVNTAQIPAASPDQDPSNNSATDIDTPEPADLTITKVSTPNPYVAGSPFTYTIVASNLGPANAPGATISDTLPPALAGFTWSCSGSGGATCGTATGTAPTINTLANMPVGGSVTILVTGTLPSGTTGVLSNTATIAPPANVPDPVMSNNSATDINPALAQADLRISKASTPNPFVPGQTLTYTIVATNAGPDDVVAARVQDVMPSAFAGFTWTCAPSPGAVCPPVGGTGDIDAFVNLAVGSTATFTSTGTVPAGYTGVADNTARITPPPDVFDPVPGNNTSIVPNPPNVLADLAITKTQTPDPYVPGSPIGYTLLVQNLGPSDVINARVQDTLPGEVTNAAWTCTAAGAGASCGAANGVNIVDAFVTLPVGTSATFTISGSVVSSATGVLSNTATVSAPATVTDLNPGNNTSTVNSGPAPQADLAIVKTASIDPYVAGTPLTFTIVARNNGPSDAPNARVQDLFPAALSSFTWTCVPSAGAATCGVASGVSLIDLLANLPVGGAITFTVTGTVPPDTTGPLTNTATVTPPIGVNDPTPTNNQSTVTLGANALADLSLTKTSTPNPYVAGLPITYTLVASNAGPSALIGGRVHDGLPAVLQNPRWTCVANNGTCPAPNGTGNVDGLVNIVPGGSVTFTITADVPVGTVGRLVNAATIVPPTGTEDPNPPNNTGIDANPSAPPPGPADLQITQEFPGVAPPNGLLTFRLVTKNLGANPALNPYVTGMIPPGTTFVSANPGAGGTCTTPGNPPAPDPATGYPIGGAAVAPLRCTWPGLMQVGASRVVEFTVRVAPATPQGQILWSCFWTWSDTEDPYHANNVIDSYMFVDNGTSPVGDLNLQAAAMSLGIVGPDGVAHDGTIGSDLAVPVGGTVKVRFWSTNAGPNATRGQYALILDTTNGLEVVDATLPQGWISPSGPSSAVWDTGPVQPGQTVTVDLTVRVYTTGALKLFAQRVAGAPGDPNASNERATIVLDGYGPNAAGRWVAVGDLDGAAAGEIVTGTGQGETPQVRVFTGTGADTGTRFFAYERPFLGGVRIASCDVNGDGIDELITAPGPGRAPTIRVLKVTGGVARELIAFDAFEPGFTGGAYVSCADLDGDGAAEVVIGAGAGRAPEVQVYNAGLGTFTLRSTFTAYESGFMGGVRVAAGAYPGGLIGAFGIATTPGPGRAPELRMWTDTGAPVAQAVISSATNGVLPTLGDVNGDGQLDLLLAPDNGQPELVRIFNLTTGALIAEVPSGLAGFPVGIRTATGVLDGGPGVSELVIGNGPGGHPRVRVIYWAPTGPVQRLEILPLEIP